MTFRYHGLIIEAQEVRVYAKHNASYFLTIFPEHPATNSGVSIQSQNCRFQGLYEVHRALVHSNRQMAPPQVLEPQRPIQNLFKPYEFPCGARTCSTSEANDTYPFKTKKRAKT